MTKSGPQPAKTTVSKRTPWKQHWDNGINGTINLFPENRVCIFPFIYKGITYYECANAGRSPTAFLPTFVGKVLPEAMWVGMIHD